MQRVSFASLAIGGNEYSKIQKGLCVFLGVANNDSKIEAEFLAEKVLSLRICEDEKGKMNLSCKDISGEIMVVSQFTLFADCTHGRRPSFFEAAKPSVAKGLYEYFIELLKQEDTVVQTGVFGEDMQITLLNDGPVTINLDTECIMKPKAKSKNDMTISQ